MGVDWLGSGMLNWGPGTFVFQVFRIVCVIASSVQLIKLPSSAVNSFGGSSLTAAWAPHTSCSWQPKSFVIFCLYLSLLVLSSFSYNRQVTSKEAYCFSHHTVSVSTLFLIVTKIVRLGGWNIRGWEILSPCHLADYLRPVFFLPLIGSLALCNVFLVLNQSDVTGSRNKPYKLPC